MSAGDAPLPRAKMDSDHHIQNEHVSTDAVAKVPALRETADGDLEQKLQSQETQDIAAAHPSAGESTREATPSIQADEANNVEDSQPSTAPADDPPSSPSPPPPAVPETHAPSHAAQPALPEHVHAPPEHIEALEQPLEVDSQLSDTDSALGDVRVQSSTASVRSSIYDYVEEHGRTYHAYNRGKYMLPNDEQEQERLDLQHHLFLMTFGLHLAPIGPSPNRVLDIATGTGIWAIEFANQYPSATVTGTDLSPIQPLYVPPNCQFEVSDAEEDWYYRQKFDYIHGRALLSCFKDPVSIARKAFDSLEPGGWYELQDPTPPVRAIDDSIKGTALERWVDGILEGAKRLGRSWAHSTNYRSYMEQAGFVDIQEHTFQWPIGTWPRGQQQKTLGLWFQQDLMDGLQGLSMAVFMRGLGWTKEEFELLLVDVRKDLKDRRIHAYVDVMVVYGRKPE